MGQLELFQTGLEPERVTNSTTSGGVIENDWPTRRDPPVQRELPYNADYRTVITLQHAITVEKSLGRFNFERLAVALIDIKLPNEKIEYIFLWMVRHGPKITRLLSEKIIAFRNASRIPLTEFDSWLESATVTVKIMEETRELVTSSATSPSS